MITVHNYSDLTPGQWAILPLHTDLPEEATRCEARRARDRLHHWAARHGYRAETTRSLDWRTVTGRILAKA